MMRLLLSLATFAFLVPLHAGDIEGIVRITRSITKKRVVVDAYAPRGGVSANTSNSNVPNANVPNANVIDEWARTLVFIDAKVSSQPAALSPSLQQIAQRNQRFDQELIIVQAGSTVSFPNEDPIFHNVFSLSKAKSFDLGYYPKGQTRKVQFDKPGPVQVFCHLHPNMNATVMVVPSPYFSQPASSGEFKISGVPAGRYTLRLWHKSAGYLTEEIEVPAQGKTQVSFLLPLASSKP